MIKETEQKDSSRVDKGLVAMFLRMTPDERLLANDNMVRTILELRNAYRQGKAYEDLLEHTVEIKFRGHIIRVLNLKALVELKKTSRDARDKQRLIVLEETLRQVNEEYGVGLESKRSSAKNEDVDQ